VVPLSAEHLGRRAAGGREARHAIDRLFADLPGLLGHHAAEQAKDLLRPRPVQVVRERGGQRELPPFDPAVPLVAGFGGGAGGGELDGGVANTVWMSAYSCG